MPYQLFISEEARNQLRNLPDDLRRSIGYRLDLVQREFSGDLKKLGGSRNHYRLRVGDYRVLFRVNGSAIEVYAVKQRKNAYE